ncbi:MAG: tetratricopeptide repeat protein [Alphaproteobacteria bacterium]|nr:tetratricopeptide repeat protein [Alphaproteobacteria bacterium]
MFENACALNPEFSAAYARLSYANFQLYTMDPALHPDAVDEALAAARQAMSADNRDALAHAAMGSAHILNGEFELAIMALKRSIDINPSLAVSHMWLAEAYAETGDTAQAFEKLDTALRLSPRDPLEAVMLYLRAWIYFGLGEYEQAENWARRSLQRESNRLIAYLVLLASLGHLGKSSEIGPVFNSMVEHFPKYAELTEEFVLSQRLLRANAVRDQLIEGLRKAGILKG